MKISLTVMVLAAMVSLLATRPSHGDELRLDLRFQRETARDSNLYHTLHRAATWNPAQTAIIVCDVWDAHHCLNAVRRLEQFVPRLNEVLREARRRGVLIIHSPSDCMSSYDAHPARQRAVDTPTAQRLPRDIAQWCSLIPAEQRGVYPIDQSDGGEDDDPVEHARWAAKLKAMGRNPATPWKKQSELITIDTARDYVSDRGNEVWNILEHRGIQNVILTGVHTNMCVLGRPFGLRQMARNGKNVVLMRDMTDTMYNPQRWPYVSHFTGTDLTISHIERFVCATITSDQFLGGKPFRFPADKRPHLVIVMAEDEYETNRTLPGFALQCLGWSFRVSYVFGSESERNDIPGLEVLDEADVALVSIRRRLLKPEQMAHVRRFIESGKPILGIRTASHAFSLRREKPPAGYVDWPDFDAAVFGGNYTNHYGSSLKSTVHIEPAAADHPILAHVPRADFAQGGSLYQTSPLAEKTVTLLTGRVEGHPAEPVAWTFPRAGGGRSFYTSLGQKADFDNPTFLRLLVNALHWAVDTPAPSQQNINLDRGDYRKHWSLIDVSTAGSDTTVAWRSGDVATGWYRCVIRIPSTWITEKRLSLSVPTNNQGLSAWWNGHALPRHSAKSAEFEIETDWVQPNDANLLVVRVQNAGRESGLGGVPLIVSGSDTLRLEGRWQMRIGDDPSWSNMPLPAKFGASADVVFEP